MKVVVKRAPAKSSSKKLPVIEGIVKSIKQKNSEKQYWWTTQSKMINPVPNMSGRAPGSLGTSTYTEDWFTQMVIDEAFALSVLENIEKHNELTLYVHDGPNGFFPVFGVIYKPSHQNKEYEYILKFTKSRLKESVYVKYVGYLYSKKNLLKHKKFGLKQIKELSHYSIKH